MPNENTQHVPVMLDEVLHFLQPKMGGAYIDGTLGGGGHTAKLLELSAPDGKVLGIDTDALALARVKQRLAEYVDNGRLTLVHGNFSELGQIAAKMNFGSVQGVLLDLGFSSDQMDDPERGFAFSADGPLDMRLNQSLPLSAADLVNEAEEEELADIFWRYGEERRSRQLAHRIVRERAKSPILRTAQLATLLAAGVPYKAGAIHPATKAFQALRIVVNHELDSLETVLPQIIDVLQVDDHKGNAGRMAIIAFHSLEDRIVKEFIRHEATDCICPPRVPVCVCGHRARLRQITRKPAMPDELEIERNPRARSARLRVAERLNGSEA